MGGLKSLGKKAMKVTGKLAKTGALGVPAQALAMAKSSPKGQGQRGAMLAGLGNAMQQGAVMWGANKAGLLGDTTSPETPKGPSSAETASAAERAASAIKSGAGRKTKYASKMKQVEDMFEERPWSPPGMETGGKYRRPKM